MSKRTLPPILKTKTSISPISVSIWRKSSVTCASSRASEPKGWTLPPSLVICATRCCSLSALRRVTTAVKPSRANRRAIAPPVASPAPITTQTLFLAMVVLLPAHSVRGTKNAQGRLRHGRLRQAPALLELGGGKAGAVGSPARRAEQIHPGFKRRAGRRQIPGQTDPRLEIDREGIARGDGRRHQTVVAGDVSPLLDIGAEQPVEHDQHAAEVGV